MRAASLAKPLVTFLLLSSSIAWAAEPLILEDARLVPLDTPPNHFGRSVDIDGDIAVVGATIGSPAFESAAPGVAYVFERRNLTSWSQVAKLQPGVEDGTSNFGVSVGVEGNTIVVGSHGSGQTSVFERVGSVWTRTALLANDSGFYVDIHSGSILTSFVEGAYLYRRGPSGWARVQRLMNGLHDADPDYPGPNLAISATTAIHGSFSLSDDTIGTAYIYPLGPNHTWQGAPVAAVTSPNAKLGDLFSQSLAISDSTAVIGGNGMFIFERNAQGVWNAVQSIPEGAPSIDGETILNGTQEGTVRVYRRTSPGVWAHQATLASSTGVWLGGPHRISGNRVIATDHVFTLPPVLNPNPSSLIQEDLEDGVANGWAPQPNSTFSVVSAGGTRVYRQTNTASGASAIFESADWDRQSIQADVTPRAYATPAGDRWFGLMVRYIDELNYYYITVRNSNRIELKRMHNGVFTTLGSAPLQVVLNRTYPLRLEAHQQLLRVFVDGRQVLSRFDGALSHGRPGLRMFRTRADFDNVILNPDPSRIYKDEHFNTPTIQMDWDYANFNLQWVKLPNSQVFTQPSTEGGAHMVAGIPRGDQSIRARMRATQFNGADRWFGLIGRYVDSQNYYYVTLRNSNNISLRKLTNGVITQLDTAPMTVAVNTWYSLRLDVVGNKLTAYVNGRLLLEATDTTAAPHTSGRAGLGSFKTAAQADDFLELAP